MLSSSRVMTVAGVLGGGGGVPSAACRLMKASQLGSLACRHSTHRSMPATRPEPSPDQPALLQPSARAPLGTLQMYEWHSSHTARFSEESGELHVLQVTVSTTTREVEGGLGPWGRIFGLGG